MSLPPPGGRTPPPVEDTDLLKSTISAARTTEKFLRSRLILERTRWINLKINAELYELPF